MNQVLSSAAIHRIVARIGEQCGLPDSPGLQINGDKPQLCAGACVVSEILREREGDIVSMEFDQQVTRVGGKNILVAEAARLELAEIVGSLIAENDRTDRRIRSGRIIERITTGY